MHFNFRNRRQDKRLRMLKKMEAMREAKARKRMAEPIVEQEPKLVRWFPLEFGVRDKMTGEETWTDLRSVRDTLRRISVVLKFYVPGITTAPDHRGTHPEPSAASRIVQT